MTKLSSKAVDLDLANDGRWCQYAGSIHVRIARINSPAYNRVLQGARKNDLVNARGEVNIEGVQRRQRIATARALVTDWWGIDAEGAKPQRFPEPGEPDSPMLTRELILGDGERVGLYMKDGTLYRRMGEQFDVDDRDSWGLFIEQVPHTKEMAEELILDPAQLDFFEWIQNEASRTEAYLAGQNETDLGN